MSPPAKEATARPEPDRCPLCGAPGPRRLLQVPDRFAPSRIYGIFRCGACRITFTHPSDDSYPPGYEPHSAWSPRVRTTGTRARIVRAFYQGRGGWGERLLLALPWLVFRARDKLKVEGRRVYTAPFRRTGRLLDVGSGRGHALKAWAPQHAASVGVETDPGAAAAARSDGLDVREGPLERQSFPVESFDAVTLCHVFEHVPDPQATLRAAAALLRPGGEMILWMPDFDSPLRRLFGACWFPYEVPRHRWHFRAADVVRLLREAGLRPVERMPDAGERVFKAGARAMRGWAGRILRRRTVRLLLLLACRLFRRADCVRIRAVKP